MPLLLQKVLKSSLLLVLLVSNICGAQTISVFSKSDQQPLPYASVYFASINQQYKKAFTSNQNGEITLKNIEPQYFPLCVTIQFPDYEKIIDTITKPQSKKYFLEKQNHHLNEVIVTAQSGATKIENSIFKARVITSKKIRAMGAQNLRDVLTNELNIRISQDQMLGSSINIQGVSGQNVKILIDGVPVIGRLDGNIDVSQINLNNVERIEIIEGPLSVVYGTDALAGTINIITKKNQQSFCEITSKNYYESNGKYNFTGRIGFQNKRHNVSISGGRNYFDGWRYNDKPFHIEKKRLADTLRYMNWKPKEQYFTTLNYNYTFKNDFKIGYKGNFFYEDILNRGFPQFPYFETAFDDTYKTYRINNGIHINGSIAPKYSVNAVVSYNYFRRIKNTYYKDLTNLEKQLSANPGAQDTSMFNQILARALFGSKRDSAVLNFQVGFDVTHQTGKGVRMLNKQQHMGDYAVFGNLIINPFKGFAVRPGLRVAYNSVYKAPLVPSIHLMYKINRWAFRFSYARGFRAPSLKELFYEFVDVNHNIVGNEQLKAEYSNNFNFSIDKKWRIKNGYFAVSNTNFYNEIRNRIALSQTSPTATTYTYSNIDKFQSFGFQLNTTLRWKNLLFSVGGAVIARKTTTETIKAKNFNYSPELKSTLRYEWKKQHMIFALFYKYTGQLPQYFLDANQQLYISTIQDYHTADVSVSRYFWKKRFYVSIGCKNLFNVKNILGTSTQSAHSSGGSRVAVGMGRTYFLKLDIYIKTKR